MTDRKNRRQLIETIYREKPDIQVEHGLDIVYNKVNPLTMNT